MRLSCPWSLPSQRIHHGAVLDFWSACKHTLGVMWIQYLPVLECSDVLSHNMISSQPSFLLVQAERRCTPWGVSITADRWYCRTLPSHAPGRKRYAANGKRVPLSSIHTVVPGEGFVRTRLTRSMTAMSSARKMYTMTDWTDIRRDGCMRALNGLGAQGDLFVARSSRLQPVKRFFSPSHTFPSGHSAT